MGASRENRKIPARRRAELPELARRQGTVTVAEIAAALAVSASTVNRDLAALAGEGMIHRSYGGATAVGRTTFEPLFEDRIRHNRPQKERIGRYAATLVEPGQSVIFSSSTVLGVVEELGRRGLSLMAVTNDVSIASALADLPGVDVVVPGGEIREGSFTLLGSYTQSFLEQSHVDVAFLGTHTITGEMLADTSISVSEAKRAMVQAARRVILLADHSKFVSPAFFEVARLDAVQDLVTDEGTDEGVLEAIRQSGRIRVHVV